MSVSATDVQQWDNDLSAKSPQEILKFALEQFDSIAISFSGAEDIVLVDMAKKLTDNVSVFTLDTGRLHADTYRYLEDVRLHYGVSIETMFPDPKAVEALIKEKGLFSFYQDDHKECCGIRKIGPLRNKLHTLDAWVTGQRKDQSPGTRTNIPVAQVDAGFSLPEKPLTKFNPLASWSSEQVWQYIRDNNVPYNPLHEKGFTSIGCEPCTRPVLPNQHEREGRWWWEEATQKECGLHSTANSSK